MEKTRLWIVTELFYPEETSTSYILTKIANKLSEKYDVYVICGPAVYDTGRKENLASKTFTLNKEVKVTRLPGMFLNKNNLILRILRFILLSIMMVISLYMKIKSGDKVLIVTNPAPLLILVSWMKRIKKFQFTILVHDVFPENTIPAGIMKSGDTILYKLLKRIFDRAYSKADLLIAIGRDMRNVLRNKLSGCKMQPPIEVIENWAETDLITPLQRKDSDLKKNGLLDNIVIQYAGNIGRVQGLSELMEIIRELRNRALYFCLWGNGALKEELVNFVDMHNISNVSFHGNYSRESQNKVLNCCDLAIITLSDGMYGLAVPSKSYNIMAAGKPILFIGDTESEVGMMVRENKIGFCFSPDDRKGIKTFFEELSFDKTEQLRTMGERARNLAVSVYSESNILDKFIELV